jgi:hypothetical protein
MVEHWMKSSNNLLRQSGHFIFFVLLVHIALYLSPAWSRSDVGEKSCFAVTGHIRTNQEEPGVKEGFIEEAIPLINSIRPDFLVFTGDVVLGGMHGKHRFSLETINAQYRYFVQNVLGKIKTKVYCVAGNHDTGNVPHPPSVKLFETLLNPLHFSFEHEGSLFLFLSLYEPFYHVAEAKAIFPFRTIWENYDTQASREFLDNLRRELSGDYDHIFIFIHACPISNVPLGYYWQQFVIPLLSSLSQDIHVFSTNHYLKAPYHAVNRVVRYHNIRFYCFGQFPEGGYVVTFDDSEVQVNLMRGNGFSPAVMNEVALHPTNRWSMLWYYINRRIINPLQYGFQLLVYYAKKVFHRLWG